MSASMAALPTAQLCFEIDEPHMVWPSRRQPGMFDHGPMPASGAGRFDQMPHPQIL
jgi:hypothetical protein